MRRFSGHVFHHRRRDDRDQRDPASHTKIAAVVVASLLAVGGGVQTVRHFAPKPREITITPQRPILTGTVRTPTGQPAARAEVLIGTPARPIDFYAKPARKPRLATDAAGKYSIEPPDDRYVLLIRCDAGYVEKSARELGQGGDVQLQPWSSIEGFVMAAGKPVPNVSVNIWAARGPEFAELEGVHYETNVRTDAQGKFVFPRVVAGETWLADRAPDNSRSLRRSYVVAEPGKTAHTTIGGAGRAVVGKFVAPPSTQPIWTSRPSPYYYDADLRPFPHDHTATNRPTHEKGESLAQYRALEEAFGKTPDGQHFKAWMFGWSFIVLPDGSFRIDDVPPGQYLLNINNMKLERELNFLENWAHGSKTITIPDDAVDQLVDVGEIKLDVIPRINPGEDAPPFKFATLDGQTKNITDYRGRNVLLISWYEHGDAEQTAKFKQVAQRWQGDGRLEVIWLSIDREETARDLAKRLGLVGTLATSEQHPIPQEYGASATSAILIDANGKFVQRHLNRNIVEKYLAKTIGSPPGDAGAKAQGPQPTAPVLQTSPAP